MQITDLVNFKIALTFSSILIGQNTIMTLLMSYDHTFNSRISCHMWTCCKYPTNKTLKAINCSNKIFLPKSRVLWIPQTSRVVSPKSIRFNNTQIKDHVCKRSYLQCTVNCLYGNISIWGYPSITSHQDQTYKTQEFNINRWIEWGRGGGTAGTNSERWEVGGGGR